MTDTDRLAAIITGPTPEVTDYDRARWALADLRTDAGFVLGDVIARLVLDSGIVAPVEHVRTLTAENERLSDEVERWTSVIESVATGDGFTTQTAGVLIAKCDERGMTATHWDLELARTLRAQEVALASGAIDRAETAEEQVRTLTAERDSARDWAVRLEQGLAAAEATVQRVRGLADRWADPWESDGMSGNAWIGMALTAAAERLHHALDAATEGGE